jgi:hypothetical protein
MGKIVLQDCLQINPFFCLRTGEPIYNDHARDPKFVAIVKS